MANPDFAPALEVSMPTRNDVLFVAPALSNENAPEAVMSALELVTLALRFSENPSLGAKLLIVSDLVAAAEQTAGC